MHLLTAHAAGRLPAAASLTVSAHVETCPACERLVAAAEDVEGRRLAQASPVALQPGALERALAAIELSFDASTESAPETYPMTGVRLPAAVAKLGLKERRFLAPGLWAAPVLAADTGGWRAFVMRTPPGVTVPAHGHRGGEMIAVLAGSFTDGERYGAGDFAEGTASSSHRLETGSDEPCVCLIAVQGRIQWRGWSKMIGIVLGL